MNTYTQDDLRNGVAQYLGLGTFPNGKEVYCVAVYN